MGLTKEQQKAIEAIAVPIEAGRAVRSHVGAVSYTHLTLPTNREV